MLAVWWCMSPQHLPTVVLAGSFEVPPMLQKFLLYVVASPGGGCPHHYVPTVFFLLSLHVSDVSH
jgi:hypothetical protein